MGEKIEQVLEESITKILDKHKEFEYYEIYYFLMEFIEKIPEKIKEETKIKKIKKYVIKEFDLDDEINLESKTTSKKYYDFSNIPKYLFEGEIKSKEPIIYIKNLYKYIGGTQLFNNANAKIYSEDKISIIGKNGVGKTTLLKMIIGKEEIDDGEIIKTKGLKIGYLSQDLFWNNKENTLKEEMLQVFPEITKKVKELKKYKTEGNYEKVAEISSFLKDIDGFRKYDLQLDILKYFGFNEKHLKLPVKNLSGGEQTKVQIAKFLIQQVDILILDEPTNHLDIEGIMFLEEFCNTWKKPIITISHDIAFINNVSNKILEIYGKKFNIYNGNYTYYLKEKEKNYEILLKKYNQQQKELEKQTEYINRFRAKASKASSVQSRIKMIDKMDFIEKPENNLILKPIKIKVDKHLPELICKMQGVKVGYDNVIIELPKKLEVHKKDKIGIIGKNGVGKTTLLKTILGELKSIEGVSELNQNIVVGSYSQILDSMDENNTILGELITDFKSEKEIRKLLGKLLIVGDKVFQKISTLSGGEKAKVGLVKMLLKNPELIIMDEPTNHLDIYTKEVIKKMIQGYDGVSIIVSHDRDLLESTSNKIWLIKDKKLSVYHNIEKAFNDLLFI